MFHHHQDHDRDAEEFVYRLMNSHACYERFVYTDTIDNYKDIIQQLQKQLTQAKRELAKTQAEYRIYKKYKTRTAISK